MSLLYVILILVVIGVLLYLLNMLPMDATIKRIIWVVVILVVVIWLVTLFFPGLGNVRVPRVGK